MSETDNSAKGSPSDLKSKRILEYLIQSATILATLAGLESARHWLSSLVALIDIPLLVKALPYVLAVAGAILGYYAGKSRRAREE